MPLHGLYIHVPFCNSRCIYCDFYSTTLGSESCKAYIDCACSEMVLRKDYLSRSTDNCHNNALHSVYLGGGTPSVLSPSNLAQIFATVTSLWHIDAATEVTLEVNPDDITPQYAEAIAALPVNRASIGVQSFHDDVLHFIHRRHTARQAIDAVNHIHAAGIDNISIDLIYGLPGQDLQQWAADLEQAFALPVSHLSAYALSFEENTPLSLLRRQGAIAEVGEEQSLRLYSMLMRQAEEAGFLHYEISNFSLPGKQSRHNSGYWSGMHYLGIGPAAHSYNGHSRQWNAPDLTAYIKARGDTIGNNLFSREHLTPQIQQEEMLLTRLRTASGLSLAEFSSAFGKRSLDSLLTRAKPYINNGTLKIKDEDTLCITRKGIFVSDYIISSLF